MKKRKQSKKQQNKSRRRKQTKRKNKLGLGKRGKDICCMCEQKIHKTKFMIPMKCLVTYGAKRAHKICRDCWWGEFARESVSHKCPGCEKGIPIKPDPNKGIVVDLTEEED